MNSVATSPAVLLATSDDNLLDDLLRLTAAAQLTPVVERDLPGLRRNWQTAGLLVIGQDLAEPLAPAQPARRPRVVIATLEPTSATYQQALAIGAEHVIRLPVDEAKLTELLADSVDGGVKSAITLAVVGGCGGAGATTFAAGLAITAHRRGIETLLIDADPAGAGIDLALGIEHAEGQRWPRLATAAGRISPSALRGALPDLEGLAVLSWDRSPVTGIPREAMRAILHAAQRSSDLIVLDLPRRPDPAAEEALVRATSTLIVVPREVRPLAAAGRLADALRPLAGDLRVVPRGTRVNAVTAVEVAEHLDAPLAAELGLDRAMADLMERGRFDVRRRGPVWRAASQLLDRYGLVERRVA